MGIFTKYENQCHGLQSGEHPAQLVTMDLAESKQGNPLLLVDCRDEDGRRHRLFFPLTNDFFREEARTACKLLLGVEEPRDEAEFYRLAGRATGREFTLLAKPYARKDGSKTQNLLVRPATPAQAPASAPLTGNEPF